MLKPLAVISIAVAAGLVLLVATSWERSSLPRRLIERPAASAPAAKGEQYIGTRGDVQATESSAESQKPDASAEVDQRPFALDAASRVPAQARAGDPAAQFELSRALDYCRRKYTFFFGREQNRRTLDQGLALAASRGASVNEARQVHERCNSIMEVDGTKLGTADEWLERAAAAGYYEARLLRAQRALIQAEFGSGDDATAAASPKETESRKAAARDVLVEGLKRKDPAALWTIGDLQRDDKDSWVWFLAACKRGYDCSQSAEWYQHLCGLDYNCQPYESGADLIRRINAGRYPDLDVLANELLEKIDAGEITDLHLR